jgi:hypothetical protein
MKILKKRGGVVEKRGRRKRNTCRMRLWKTRELEYLFFLSRKARNFFQKINIKLYNKNSESDYFFFPPPKSEYFFQQHWESEYFFRKKT